MSVLYLYIYIYIVYLHLPKQIKSMLVNIPVPWILLEPVYWNVKARFQRCSVEHLSWTSLSDYFFFWVPVSFLFTGPIIGEIYWRYVIMGGGFEFQFVRGDHTYRYC